MKKFIKSSTLLYIVVCFLNASLFATTFSNSLVVTTSIGFKADKSLFFAPPAAPIVQSPIYYCQNSPASPLTATADPGNTLFWYGTAATGGTPSITAPTPSTNSVGSTTYYVSQTDGSTVSPRAQIVVNVVANNGAVILNYRCDPSQVLAPDKASSVMFDWSNNPLISNTYNYTYTIQGGSPVSGTTNVSHQQVFGMLPGQSATMTLSSATHPCVPPQTITCTVPCGTATTNPNFAPIPPFCTGSPAPILGPTSPNGISGTWAPAVVSNTASGNYVFTPDPFLHPCATTQTLSVTVKPLVTMSFTSIPANVCQGSTYSLPTSSNNTPPITGTWSPSTVDTSTLGSTSYTFTSNPGQCTSASTYSTTITVIPNNVTPTFNAVGPICSGDPLAPLPTVSNEGITGSWSPGISNTATTTYTFTPNAGQCALNTTMTVTVNSKVTPTFNAVAPICSGDALAPLPTFSNNGYSGSWSPILDNTKTTTYTFTPTAGQCANNATLTVTVNAIIVPVFSLVPSVICENSGDLVLPTNSENTPPITGTWSPAFVDSSVLGTVNYVFTPDGGQCASSKTLPITVKESNTLIDFQWTVTDAFVENQVVTINATAAGEYVYQFDFGPFQSSPIFENVPYGLHSVTVKDPVGCSAPITKSNILVVDFPRFFTPNGDGFNDSWNIETLKDDVNARIHIFDRYGKFLVEIKPNSVGWSGYYNGHPMPATDYWFTIDYVEANVVKKFKSHFSLKR
ncbi:T9SS type B sorting domain-containing protein [Flavobacterium ovatum]|uniref:T9SS type B sorting domain-containing protein n=1 Tax=Flavobacterium ovatum TaxID=1928857 RepID=UPI003450559B